MKDIFVQSQWDTLLAFLRQGHPPLWALLAVVNGGFLVFWIYAKIGKDRPLRRGTANMMRVLFVLFNIALVFRDETLRLLQPFLRYFT
jgi:hypothetical protein